MHRFLYEKRNYYFQIMATSDKTDEIDLQSLKVEESTTIKPEASATDAQSKPTKPKKEKQKQDKPKQDKPKQEKPKQEKAVTTAEAPAEELDFNRSPDEVATALDQWSKAPTVSNKKQPNEKM